MHVVTRVVQHAIMMKLPPYCVGVIKCHSNTYPYNPKTNRTVVNEIFGPKWTPCDTYTIYTGSHDAVV